MWRRFCPFGISAALVLFGSEAAAQDSGVGGQSTGDARTGPSWGRPEVVDTPETQGPAKQGRNSIKLFDSYRSIISYQLDVGPIWTRRANDTTPLSRRTNFDHKAPLAGEIAIGSYYQTPSFKGPFYLTSEQGTAFLILDDKSFLWSIFLNKLGGGVKFGPFELEGKVGIHALSVDIMHAHPSIQLVSPRAEASLGLHLGRFRVDISGHTEYLWRWFGPSYYVRGINIGLRLDRARPKTPFPGGPPE
jgi:hypothetical protein